jgi:RNA polymerase sigma factor (sigma-70 family)
MRLLRQVTGRLARSYSWIGSDELESYAWIGLIKAARSFDANRSRSFGAYAAVKGVYHAVDEMRRDGLLRRPGEQRKDPEPLCMDVPDPRAGRALAGLARKDLTEALLAQLEPQDRALLMMYYGKGMNFREIAQVRQVTESAVCIRHGQIIRRLRHKARLNNLAPVPESSSTPCLSLTPGDQPDE